MKNLPSWIKIIFATMITGVPIAYFLSLFGLDLNTIWRSVMVLFIAIGWTFVFYKKK